MEITINKERSRFETPVAGGYAFLDYEMYDSTMALTHTYVPPRDRNQGIAFELVHFALEYAKAEHLKIIPGCSSVALYIEEHPEYEELIDPEYL